MIRKLIVAAVVVGLIGLAAFWVLTTPKTIAASDLPTYKADLANGEKMFWIGGCDSCHAKANAEGDDLLKLGGGQVLATPFGSFHVPNISPDPVNGIGKWTLAEFVTAMKFGVGPGGVHLYPAFPYTSYQRMKIDDIIDLKGFMDTLPPVADANTAHELPFPFNIRRGIGLWKLLYVDGETFEPDPAASDQVNRGAYLVLGPGHCAECHTPRGIDGGPNRARAFAGGPSPDRKGKIPNITQSSDGIGDWSDQDLMDFFHTGILWSGDVVGGAMAPVQKNLARLPDDDLAAIAAFLKTIPPLDNIRATKP